jgi:PTH2 family peptidyl-tRNA hydrolase
MSEKATYILMRRDLKMRRGKEIAQACHAALGLGLSDCATITLQVETEADLLAAIDLAKKNGWNWYAVRDAGHTEVERGTMTCAAIRADRGAFKAFRLY